MNLNIGSGHKPKGQQTFLYVDAIAWPVDIKADVRRLPFADGTFRLIHCSHVLEHVPYRGVDAALRELRRVLHPDGIMYCSGPDMASARAAGSSQWVGYTLHGGWREGWGHRWVCSSRRLRRLLILGGFVPTWIKAVPPGFPANTHQWPVEFEARFVCRRSDYPWPRGFPSDWLVER